MMFFLKSLIYTLFSPAFYKEAVQKGQKKAFGVFTLFTVLTSLLVSGYFIVNMLVGLKTMPEDLKDFPEITVMNGTLSYAGEMPVEFTEEGQYFALDTTGELTEIPTGYYQGVLLTKYTMILRSENNYGDQEIGYDQLLASIERDNIIINEQTITNLVNVASLGVIIASPFVITLWNFIAHLLVVLVIAFIGFIVFSLMKEPDAFRKSFIIALYASIPILYINVIEVGLVKLIPFVRTFGTCCMVSIAYALIKWGVFWGIGAYGIRNDK